jgi:hypothetical protein
VGGVTDSLSRAPRDSLKHRANNGVSTTHGVGVSAN